MSRRALLLGTAAAGALTVAGAAGCSRVPSGDALARLKSQGTVRLGIAGEVPYGYVDEQGEFTGEAPELAKVIFKRLGIDSVQPVATDFASLIPGLNSQQFDVVSAGMYINKERCQQVIFSDPEYQMLDAFIVRKGNPLNLRSYEDVVEKNARFSTGTGYAEIGYAIAAGIPEEKIVILRDQVAGLNAVESGLRRHRADHPRGGEEEHEGRVDRAVRSGGRRREAGRRRRLRLPPHRHGAARRVQRRDPQDEEER
jgi:polar amino acid transport system substrate-binding protein